MAGLIKSTQQVNTNLNKPNSNYQAAQTQTANVTADEREVDSKSTVQGQLGSLLDKGGDYMKRAETKGLQVANSRGLLNTDMAISAAHGAAIDAAMPIATQDAQTYNNQALTNQGYANQSDQINAQSQNTANLANQQATNRASEFNASMDFDQWNAERDRENQEFLTRLDQSGAMQQMDAEVAANLKGEYVKSWDKARQDTVIAIEKIQMNPDISGADKQKMIEQEVARRNADMSAMKSIFSSLPQWQQDWAEFTRV